MIKNSIFFFCLLLISCNQKTDNSNVLVEEKTESEKFHERAIEYFHSQEYGSALVEINKAIKSNPNEGFYYYTKALIKQELGDYSSALDDYSTSISLIPNENSSSVYRSRAYLKAYLRDYKGAISDFDKVITPDSKDFFAITDRGRLKLEIGNITGACIDLRRAGEMGDTKAYEYIKKYCN